MYYLVEVESNKSKSFEETFSVWPWLWGQPKVYVVSPETGNPTYEIHCAQNHYQTLNETSGVIAVLPVGYDAIIDLEMHGMTKDGLLAVFDEKISNQVTPFLAITEAKDTETGVRFTLIVDAHNSFKWGHAGLNNSDLQKKFLETLQLQKYNV